MRSAIIALILFITVVALVILNAVYVNKTCNTMIALANEEELNCTDLKDYWKKHRKPLSLTVEDDELERMNNLIEEISLSYEKGDPEQLSKSKRLFTELCRELAGYERPSLVSIF